MNLLWSSLLCILFSVTKVIDGDTIRLSNGETVRLIGIDAPESRNAFYKEKAPYGVEAKKYLAGLLKDKKVRLEYDAGRKDRYGRTLVYVYLEDGTFVNEKLVREGYAMVMTVPPNVLYAERFVKLQQEARENGRGLWGDATR